MSWEICKGDMRFFGPSDSVNTTPILLTLLDPVALPVNSSRNTRARVEEPPDEIMIVLFLCLVTMCRFIIYRPLKLGVSPISLRRPRWNVGATAFI